MIERYIRLYLSKNDISDDETELIIYGLYRLLLVSAGIVVALLIGLLFKSALWTALFLVFFVPLRNYGGGFHLDSLSKCAVTSALLIVADIVIHRFTNINLYVTGIITVVFGAAIFMLAPKDCRNKRLLPENKSKLRIKTRIVLIIHFAAFIVSCIWGWKFLSDIVMLSIANEGLSIVIAYITDKGESEIETTACGM